MFIFYLLVKIKAKYKLQGFMKNIFRRFFYVEQIHYVAFFFLYHTFGRKILINRCLLTLSLPLTRWAGDNSELPSNSNISKTIRISIAFTKSFFREYSITFLMILRLIDFALVVL